MVLLVIALFGLVVPNGMFVYALAHDFPSLAAAFSDRLALSLLIDAVVAVGLLAFVWAVRPIGPVKWPWFVAMSLLGGLGFSVPFYLWLNWRRAPATKSLTDWIRGSGSAE